MKLGFRLLNPQWLGALTVMLQAATAAAQDPAPAPAPAAAAPAPPPVAPTPVAPPPEAPATVVDEPALAPPAPLAAAEPAPVAEEKKPEPPPPLNIGAWSRVDLRASSADGRDLDDLSSTGEFELHLSGKLLPWVSFTTNFVATYGGGDGTITGDLGVMDGIIQLEPCDFFNVWLGRMLVPVDRSNFSGPYFMAPWYYPGFGFADGQVGAPLEGPNGRNDGVTVWGQFNGGMVKYYAGAFDLHDVDQKPLYSGRLSLSLLNPEPGYYGSSTYYGKDLLGIGVGVQSKGLGSVQTDPTTGAITAADKYTEFNADVLFEKDLGGAGVLDIEGAVYLFGGDYRQTDSSWFALASYLLPGDIGPGKLQPLVRVQQAAPHAEGADTSTLVDLQLGYIVNSYNTRFALGYQNGSAGDAKVQGLFFGAQILK
jgi:hypothetical protein